MIIFPSDFMISFLTRIFTTLKERGTINPCMPTFISDFAGYVTSYLRFGLNERIIYLSIVIFVLYITYRAGKYLISFKKQDNYKIIVFLSSLSYLLVLPRCKDYYYIILIPAAYYLTQKIDYLKPKYLILAAMIIFNSFECFPHLGVVSRILFENASLVIAISLWSFYIYEIFRKKPNSL